MYAFAPERSKWRAIRNLLLINSLSVHFSKVWISPLMHTLIMTDNNPAFTLVIDLRLEKVRGQESYARGIQLVHSDCISVTLSGL